MSALALHVDIDAVAFATANVSSLAAILISYASTRHRSANGRRAQESGGASLDSLEAPDE